MQDEMHGARYARPGVLLGVLGEEEERCWQTTKFSEHGGDEMSRMEEEEERRR